MGCCVPNAPKRYRRLPLKQQEAQWASRRNGSHALYNDWRWRDPKNGLRVRHLRKEPLCQECLRHGIVNAESLEVDHKVPHGGDEAKFFDEDGLETLCKSHHSAKTVRDGGLGQ